MNPKVRIIIEETFPKIVERHRRTRPAPGVTEKSLEMFWKMGYSAVRNLPPADREENERALDSAYTDAIQQVRDISARGKTESGSPEETH